MNYKKSITETYLTDIEIIIINKFQKMDDFQKTLNSNSFQQNYNKLNKI